MPGGGSGGGQGGGMQGGKELTLRRLSLYGD